MLNTTQNLVFGMAAVGNKTAAAHASLYTKDNYLKFITNAYDVEYINDESGLRQNFIIKNKPAGNEALQVSMKVSGSLIPSVLYENVLQLSHKPSGKVYIK